MNIYKIYYFLKVNENESELPWWRFALIVLHVNVWCYPEYKVISNCALKGARHLLYKLLLLLLLLLLVVVLLLLLLLKLELKLKLIDNVHKLTGQL